MKRRRRRTVRSMTDSFRKAEEYDLPELLEVYEQARAFMRENGNPSQWAEGGYPPRELIEEDVKLGRLTVLVRGGRVVGAFVLAEGEEPTYRVIEGDWGSERPYLTLHRIASLTDEHGVGSAIIGRSAELAKERGLDLRIDTHEANSPMLHVIKKHGFSYCGVIYVRGGSKRLAFRLGRETDENCPQKL